MGGISHRTKAILYTLCRKIFDFANQENKEIQNGRLKEKA